MAWLLLGLAGPAAAQQQTLPRRQIPPAVLSEVAALTNRFELALAMDCDPRRCFSKGCTYVDHAVVDRPRATSLPGLGGDAGPGSVAPQEFLTQARCAFAHEEEGEAGDIQVLVRRLQSKLSTPWTVVTVERQGLQPLPEYLRDPPVAPAPVEAPEPPPPPAPPPPEAWSSSVAGRELWTTLLPHLAWMIAVVLVTLAGGALIWAWRRVGRDSLEDQLLAARLTREAELAPAPEVEVGEEDPDAAFVAEQAAAWAGRLGAMDPARPDPVVQALVRDLLRAGEHRLLATAVVAYPSTFPAAFPSGGDIAAAKLELADFLEATDPATLVADAAFYRPLHRPGLAAAVRAQADAEVVRGLRDEFGAAGLVSLLGQLPARPGAVLFALAPTAAQLELVHLLPPGQLAGLAEMLLRSDRLGQDETDFLFRVLGAVRAGDPLPEAPPAAEVADRGAPFEAAGALSVLLAHVDQAARAALFGRALQRHHGHLPSWIKGVLTPDMLLHLSTEARADLLLEVEVEAVAAWLSIVDPEARSRVLHGLPDALRRSVSAASTFPSRDRQLALAERGRRDLAAGLQRQLARARTPFEQVVAPEPPRSTS